MTIKKWGLGNVARVIAAFYTTFIVIVLIAASVDLIKSGLEFGFEILRVKLAIYIIIALYLIYGSFALFKNIQKTFPLSIIFIFLLMNFDLGFSHINSVDPPINYNLVMILFFLVPIVLIITAVKKGDNDANDIFNRWFGKGKPWINIIFAILFTMFSARFINLQILKVTRPNDELLTMVQQSINLTINYALLFVGYSLTAAIVNFLFKDKSRSS